MNLSALMNDGGEEESSPRKNTSPEAKRNSQPSGTTPAVNGHHAQGYAHPHAHPQVPLPGYGPPPSLPTARSSGSQGFPQLHTPGQGPPDYRYRSQDGFSATTPGGRPPTASYGYPVQQSPSSASIPLPHQSTSASPTPSSHHSQHRHTPGSVRQSPQAVMSQPPNQPPSAGMYQQSGAYQQSPYTQAQPRTPHGPPPPLLPQHSSSYLDMSSPVHSRTFSGTSQGNAFTAQSPAAISNLVESPNTFHRPSPADLQRHSTQYLTQQFTQERERSLSVSPKTQVMPRPHSQRSSVQDLINHVPPRPREPSNEVLDANGAGKQSVVSAPPNPPNLPHHTSEATNMVPPAEKQLKRPAPEPAQEPPAKRTMTRKYTQRPPWAVLSKHNPRFKHGDAQANGHAPTLERAITPRGASQQPNGTVPISETKPWQQHPPLDHDLIGASAILGKWEKSFRWNTPYPPMLKCVQDWLFEQFSGLQDVGMHPKEGTIEVEARVGVLKKAGSDDRLRLPVLSTTVLDPATNSDYHFESRMTEAEHSAMNKYLNAATAESMADGRVRMTYDHTYEADFYHPLSATGLAALPTSIQRRNTHTRPPRLRITRATRDRPSTHHCPAIRAGQILGRIVKMPISDLHIYNPQYNYDTRISLALEVNLDRPDIDPTTLIAAESATDRGPDRIKDRVSYRHLAYSIDLTKVDMPGQGAGTYELEVEVDSRVLREQMERLVRGEASAFGDVVGGFLDNVTFLTRQGPVG
ncbi:uncharacterized protein LTR77_003352 [Saxophila tyrrhenica]|uniref:mRNA-capping enzyme subunit beta n=1 Tax=Saxophila tyrrhenica TaxID=1690608 RepID=A0AAV9PGD1_9PEZI|nr:hypothetical protein LTR77_003352 [Saxophila tyrrhenica]